MSAAVATLDCRGATSAALRATGSALEPRRHRLTAHARRIRPATGPVDRRPIVAAALSALLPGLGQLLNGRRRLALVFLVPSLIVLTIVVLVVRGTPAMRLIAALIVPSTLGPVLLLNALVLGWRLVAVVHAFADSRYRGGPDRRAVAALGIILLFVVVPQTYAGWVGYSAFDNFKRVFAAEANQPAPAPGPADNQRLNVLLIGVDSGSGRDHALADTLIVVSLDPVGRTVSLASIPRDLTGVPLGNGDTFAPKINSLLAFADRNRVQFPGGGRPALEHAVGALLGIPIHYYAQVNLAGFVRMVDAVGGVDVVVKRPLTDPNYGGFGVGPGWSIAKGPHHLDGPNALAYTRIRKSVGESDFTRAERQQEVLVAVRNAAVKRNVLFNLTTLLDAVGDTVKTDLPAERLPGLAALADEIGADATTRVVLEHPLVHPASNQFGSVQVADLAAIRAVAALLFTAPGTPPTPWPTPIPGKSARPAASSTRP